MQVATKKGKEEKLLFIQVKRWDDNSIAVN
jgi:hypothetical protein